jgi:hypothetical protein
LFWIAKAQEKAQRRRRFFALTSRALESVDHQNLTPSCCDSSWITPQNSSWFHVAMFATTCSASAEILSKGNLRLCVLRVFAINERF